MHGPRPRLRGYENCSAIKTGWRSVGHTKTGPSKSTAGSAVPVRFPVQGPLQEACHAGPVRLPPTGRRASSGRCEIRQEERASDGSCHGARESNLEAILGLLQIQEPYRPMADFRPAFEPAETRIRRPAPRRPCAGRTSSTSALFLCRGPRPGDLLICAAPPRSRPPHPARCSLCACV